MKELFEKISKGTRKKTVKVLAGVVAFATAYSLILPAITIDEETAQEEPGMVLNENENSEEVLAEYEAPEEVVEEAPVEEPATEEAPAEEVKEEAPAEEVQEAVSAEEVKEETPVEEVQEEAPAEEAKPAEETKPAEPAEEPKQEAPEIVPEATAGKIEYEAKEDYKVTVEYTKDAGFAEGTELDIKETLKEDEYANSLVKAQKEFEEEEIAQARFFETVFMAEGEEYKTAKGKVIVTYEPEKMEIEENQEITVLTTDSEGEYEEIDEKKLSVKEKDNKIEEIKFETEDLESFTILVLEKEAEEAPAEEVKEEAPAAEETPSEEAEEETAEETPAMPEVSFAKTAGDVTVTVEAPEGAFPEGTEMEIELVDESQYMDAINSTISEDETVKKAQAVDIRFIYNGEEIEPQKEIKVNLISNVIKQTEDPKLIHIDNKGEASIVETTPETKTYSEEINNPFKSESVESLTFTSDEFSVYIIVETIEQEITLTTPDGEDVTYVVSVTYGPEANIPKGSTLVVKEFAEGSDSYKEAKKAVIADKIARNDTADVNIFEMAALDISIVNPEGVEIEPEAPVQVELKIKELPGVENLSEISDTLAIQHHVETDKGIVVEKVFDGSNEAAFQWNTDEEISTTGNAVNPETVDLSQYGTSSLKLLDDGIIIEENTVTEIDANFTTEAFSKFTITWTQNNASIDSSVQINGGTVIRRTANLSDGYYIIVAENGYNDHHMFGLNSSGNAVATAIQNNALNIPSYGNNATFSYNTTLDAGYIWQKSGNSLHNMGSSSRYLNLGNNNFTSTTSRDLTFTEVGNSGYSAANTRNRYTIRVGRDNGRYLQYNNSFTSTTSTTADGRNMIFLKVDINTSPHATVRYVDESGNELAVSNSNFRGDNLTQSPAYLIYDIDGYEYVKTTLGTVSGTAIRPMLRYNSNRWQYTTSNSTNGNNNITWTNLDYNTESHRTINVVYRKKATPTDGGTPKAVESDEKPLDPKIHKNSTPNGDGTNTLALQITGHTVPTKVERLADVIVIFDISGSMNRTMNGNDIDGQDNNDSAANSDESSRLYMAYDAVRALTNTLLSDERVNSDGEKLIRMSLVSFSNSAQVVSGFTDDPSTFINAVGGLHADGGTNWEAALRLANTSFTKAESSENVGPYELDPDRATFIVFVTDGEPTFRLTRYNVADNGFNNDISDGWYRVYGVFGQGNSDTHSYNYNGALTEATTIVGNKKNLYSIGISESETALGKLTDLMTESGAGSDHSVIATTEENLIKAFDDIAEKIAGVSGFGDINMTDGITDLSNTVMEKSTLLGVADDFVYWKANAPANWATMTREQKEAYQPLDTDFVEWDPSTERCAEASYNETTGAVEWHMGPNFVPEDGCTYKVTFTVWPSQEAYDWIADLKNGTRTWQDVVDAGLNYPDGPNPQIVDNGDGTYDLATNKPGANTTYKSALKTGETVVTTGEPTTLDFNTVKPMALAEKKMAVRKRFSHEINSVSPLTKIQFTLYEGTEPYKKADGTPYTLELPTVAGATPEQYQYWEQEVFIAPGLLKTISADPGYQVLEAGHDYTLVEDIITGDKYEYVFTPQIVRPMVVGTELKYFVKKDTEYNTNPQNKKEYTIEGGTYYELDSNSQALTGTNRKTSELDITKVVIDATGNMTEEQLAAETFTYKITLTVPEGADTSGMMAYEYVPRLNDTVPGETGRPRFYLFGYQDETFQYVDINGETKTQEADAASSRGFSDDVSKFKKKVYGGWNAQINSMFGDSNTITFYMTLDNDEIIRLTNLPQNTQYTITEYYANVNKSDVGAPSPESSLPSNIAAQGYTVTVKQDLSSTAVATNTISGTITELDKRYYNQFTNTLNRFVDVEIKARKHLDGYEWSGERYYINLTTDDGNPLPGANGRTRFYRSFPQGSAGNADVDGYTFGKVRFTAPGTYKYYIDEDNAGLVIDGIAYDESKTVTIVVAENQSNHQLYVESVQGDDTEWNAETNTSLTTITNRIITAKVKVLKIGDSDQDNPLSDVSFELYKTYVDKDSPDNVKAKKKDGTEYGTLTTGADGTFIITDLIPTEAGNTYYLVETNAKDGYHLLSGPVEITVYLTDEEPFYEVSYSQTDYTLSNTQGRIEPDDEGNCTIIVDNKSGAELPHTGGSGTLPYTLGGLVLIILSASMYGFIMRRRERRFDN